MSQRAVKDTVAAILLKDGKFLVEKRRADDDSDPGFIAIPGGHVEPGETFEHALRREMTEELGIKIRKPVKVCMEYHTTTNGERNRAHYFRIDQWDGTIMSSTEAEAVYWESSPEKLTAEADRKAIRRVV